MDAIYIVMEMTPAGGDLIGWETDQEAAKRMGERQFAAHLAADTARRERHPAAYADDPLITAPDWQPDGERRLASPIPGGAGWMEIIKAERGMSWHIVPDS